MHKEYLLTPGPTVVPDRILKAMSCAQLHHRTSVFKAHLGKASEGLRWLTGSQTQPIVLTSSGTGGLEAVISNLCKEGTRVMAINAGPFASRWVKIAKRYHAQVVEVKAAEGESPSLEALESALRANPETELFLVQYSETSTTVLHPVPAIATLVRKHCPQSLVCVDAISAIGTLPINFADMPIDIVVGASQKAFGVPPGLAFLCFSLRAWEAVEKGPRQSLYFDLLSEREKQSAGTTSWTPATTLVLGFNEAIEMMKEEGLPEVYARHQRLSRMTRTGLRALGCRLLAEGYASPGVTGALPPQDISADALRKTALEQFGVRMANGQSSFEGKAIRIGHMGWVYEADILAGLEALELSLEHLGYAIERGSAVTCAAQEWR